MGHLFKSKVSAVLTHVEKEQKHGINVRIVPDTPLMSFVKKSEMFCN